MTDITDLLVQGTGSVLVTDLLSVHLRPPAYTAHDIYIYNVMYIMLH